MSQPVNVAEHLTRMALQYPEKPAIHFPLGRVHRSGTSPHQTISFSELNRLTDALAHGLVKSGITRGTRTALMVPPCPEFFELTFALLKVGAIPVLIDPGMGLKNLGKCLEQAAPEAFIGIRKAHVARWLFGWAKQTLRFTVNVGQRKFFCTTSSRRLSDNGVSAGPFVSPPMQPDDPAAILFTSGSTGVAKGVLYTHGIFSAQVELLKQVYGIEPGEVDLCSFPLFALFGPALGMTCVIPQMNASRPASCDPRKLIAQARQFKITNLFGSPAVIRRLADSGLALPETLRRVISAGAPAVPNVIERFCKLLPSGVQVFTPYGATESLPVANIGSTEILRETRFLTELGRGVCVGHSVPCVEVQVMPILDEAVESWSRDSALSVNQIGELIVRGPVVTKEYFRKPDSTKLAKIRDAETGETWHRMGDVGYFDEQRRIWFCGRKSHRVETASGPLFTDQIEPIFNQVDGVARSALVGVRRGAVTYPVLCIEPVKGASFRECLVKLQACSAKYELTRQVKTFLWFSHSSGFPVDVRHNSKIFREKLAHWADQQLGPHWKGDA